MRIQELFEIYKNNRLLSEASIKNYKSLLNLYQKDNKTLDIYITYDQVIIWRNKIINRASPITWNSYLAQLKALFNFALEQEIINSNIFTQVKSISCHKKHQKTLTPGQIEETIEMCDEFENPVFLIVLIKTLYYTGMRRKQITSLKWRHIDLENMTITLSASGSKNKTENLIPLCLDLYPYILLLAEKSKPFLPDTQVFSAHLYSSNIKTNTLTTDHISYIFRKLSEKLPFKVSTHRFRHTMASKIANSGGNIKALQEVLGHKSIVTTMGYVKPNMQDLKKNQDLL